MYKIENDDVNWDQPLIYTNTKIKKIKKCVVKKNKVMAVMAQKPRFLPIFQIM